MKNIRPIIYGAGGHGKVVLGILRSCGYADADITIFDDDPERVELCGAPVVAELPAPSDELGYIVAIGNNLERWAIATELDAEDYRPLLVVSPRAYVSPHAGLDAGTVVCPFAQVGPGATIGDDCILNTGCDVEHDAQVGACSHIGPGAVVCGGARVGRDCLIGARAVILPGVRVPDRCVIGAGAVVTKHTALRPERTLVGVPARQLKKR